MQLSYVDPTESREATDKPFIHPLTRTRVPGDTGTVTYVSSNKGVATVNEDTGEVTIVTAGQTTITATKAAAAGYAESTAQYVLTVRLSRGSVISYGTTAVYKSLSDDPFTIELARTNVPADTGTVTYFSSTPVVATVNEGTGEVTIVASGLAVIVATKAATSRYAENSVFYILTVR